MSRPLVSIVILNWNGWRDTTVCLDSVLRLRYPNYRIVVVDNGSEDHSIQEIIRYCEKSGMYNTILVQQCDWSAGGSVEPGIDQTESSNDPNLSENTTLALKELTIIPCPRNYGFAGGNNIGMEYCLRVHIPDYLLLLNNDTVVDEGFLDALVEVAESDSRIAIAGPKVLYYINGRTDIIDSAGGGMSYWKGKARLIGMGEKDDDGYDLVRTVDFVFGACMLVRKNAMMHFGLLPKDYFLYWEENNWCERARLAGFKCVYVGRSRIWHKAKSSIQRIASLGTYYKVLNRFRFMHEFATTSQFVVFLIYFFSFRIWFELVIVIFSEGPISFERARPYLRGVIDGIRDISGT